MTQSVIFLVLLPLMFVLYVALNFPVFKINRNLANHNRLDEIVGITERDRKFLVFYCLNLLGFWLLCAICFGAWGFYFAEIMPFVIRINFFPVELFIHFAAIVLGMVSLFFVPSLSSILNNQFPNEAALEKELEGRLEDSTQYGPNPSSNYSSWPIGEKIKESLWFFLGSRALFWWLLLSVFILAPIFLAFNDSDWRYLWLYLAPPFLLFLGVIYIGFSGVLIFVPLSITVFLIVESYHSFGIRCPVLGKVRQTMRTETEDLIFIFGATAYIVLGFLIPIDTELMDFFPIHLLLFEAF